MASPFVTSALYIFGASSFGDFDRLVSDVLPLPSIEEILGHESGYMGVITGLVGILYDRIQEGAESVVNTALLIPSGDEFAGAIRSQFSGSCISLFFIVGNRITCFVWHSPHAVWRIMRNNSHTYIQLTGCIIHA